MSTPTLRRSITDDLRGTLERLPPGASLPSEHSLKAHYGVARGTIRIALQALADAGLIVSRPGKGWVRRDTRPAVMDASAPERSTATDDTWAAGIRAQGRQPTQRLRVEIVAGPRWATDMLHLPAGEVLVVRRRWRYADGILANTADTYYRESLVRGTAITRPEELVPGAYRVMAELARPWDDRPEDRIVARALTEPEREMFDAASGLPAVEMTRIRWSTDGAPTAVTRILLPGGRNELVYNPRTMEES